MTDEELVAFEAAKLDRRDALERERTAATILAALIDGGLRAGGTVTMEELVANAVSVADQLRKRLAEDT